MVKTNKLLLSSVMRSIVKSVVLTFVSILIAFVLMVGIYSIPTGRAFIYAGSCSDFFSENLTKTWTGNLRYAKIDTATDAYLFNMALCRAYESPIKNAMLNPLYVFENGREDVIQNSTTKVMNGEISDKVVNYGRYWQGSIVFILLGLNFFDISGLKTISMITVFGLMIALLFELNKKNKTLCYFSFVVLMFLNPVTISMNFGIFFIFSIAIFSSILAIRYHDYFEKNDRFVVLMTISGVLTSFLDFFTFPLLSYGMPLLYILCFSKDEKIFIKLLKGTFAWLIGYAGMWAGKWAISYFFVGPDMINDAISTILLRTSASGPDGNFSYFLTLKRIFEVFDNSYLLLVASSIIVACYFLFIYRDKVKLSSKMISILIVGCSPFVWYFVVRNHAYIHPWFEYRQLAVSLLSIFVAFCCLFNND